MKRQSKRLAIAIVGGCIVLIGAVAIPYPGPGWLIVFSGLAVLSIEFEWARRTLHFARKKYDAWEAWVLRQHISVRLGLLAMTCVVVLATLYLLNTYGFINQWLGLGWDWLQSPLPWF